GVSFQVDGTPIGGELSAPPFSRFWDSASVADGTHTLTAVARDAAGHSTTSAPLVVSTANTGASLYPLKLASGQRYAVAPVARPFRIPGDSPGSLIATLTNEDAELYLEDRRGRGFNALIVNLLEHQFAADAPRNAYGQPPFTVAGDFSTPNEAYFAHADDILQRASAKGMVVFLTPAYLGFGGGNEGWYQEMAANGTSKLFSYGQ